MFIRLNYYKANLPAIFLLLVTLYSCGESPGKIVKKELPKANVPAHTFKMPYDRLRDTIPSLFTFERQYENKYLKRFFFYYFPRDEKNQKKHLIKFSSETSKNPVFSNNYFKKPNTEGDIFLTTMGEHWKSPVYFANGKALLYQTAFICKLEKIDNYNTKVTVFAEDPLVVNGTNGLGPHGYVANVQKVAPTTIEEYSILLYIADQLGDKTLRPINVPLAD